MKLGILITTFTLSAIATAAPSVSVVTAKQRYPWNGKVDISYIVNGNLDSSAAWRGTTAILKVSAFDHVSGKSYIATTLSGDMSTTEGRHDIVWDMNAQGLTFKSTNVVFCVTYEPTTNLYCIVDLSSGANAQAYSISYTNEICTNAYSSGGWSDEYKTSKLVLRRIEPGTCVVSVGQAYYIGVFEVTQKQYELITGKNPAFGTGDGARPVEKVSYNMIRGSNKGAAYPESLDVDDDSFMGRLRNRTGHSFDLPTETQWEYACRAGTTTTYNYGNVASGSYMWYSSNADWCARRVGLLPPNRWGLYDVHGNIYEWCLDWFEDKYNPPGECRMIRGGCWRGAAVVCTSACRIGYQSPSSVRYDIGFRLVMNISSH